MLVGDFEKNSVRGPAPVSPACHHTYSSPYPSPLSLIGTQTQVRCRSRTGCFTSRGCSPVGIQVRLPSSARSPQRSNHRTLSQQPDVLHPPGPPRWILRMAFLYHRGSISSPSASTCQLGVMIYPAHTLALPETERSASPTSFLYLSTYISTRLLAVPRIFDAV